MGKVKRVLGGRKLAKELVGKSKAGKMASKKGLPAAGKSSGAAASTFGTTKRAATRSEKATRGAKAKVAGATKPSAVGFGAVRSGKATPKQVMANTGSKRMKAGAAAGGARNSATAAGARASKGASRTSTAGVVGRGGSTTKTTVRMGGAGEASSRATKNLSSGAMSRKSTTYTASRKAVGTGVAGTGAVGGAGGYTTYKRKTKSGKTVTVRRKK